MADQVLSNLGRAYLLNKEWDQAEACYMKAIEYSGQNWNAFSGLADLYEIRNNFTQAALYHQQAVELAEKGSGYQHGTAIVNFYERFQGVYKAAIRFYVRHGKSGPALETAEKFKARYLAFLTNQGTQRFQNVHPSVYTDRLNEIERQISLWHQQQQQDKDSKRQFEIYALETERERYLDSLSRSAPDLYKLKQSDTVNTHRLILRLPPQYQLLEWVLHRDSLIGIVVRDGIVRSKIVAIDCDQVRKSILKISSRVQLYEEELHRLYGQIFLPFEEWLEPGKETIIIPDDALYYLPVEMLVTRLSDERTGFQPEYLLQRYPVSYAVSLTSLIDRVEMKSNADRNYIGLASSHFYQSDPLPGAVEQVIRGQRIFYSSDVSTDQTRNKRILLDNGQKYKIIDIATHVQISDADPLHSRIVFYDHPDTPGRASPEAGDETLYVYELFRHAIMPDLLVLSGCQSGTGRLTSGEGFIGFNHALSYSGTAGLLLSMWPVDDRSTSELLGLFYKHIQKGESKSKALQKAKIEYIRLASEMKTNPRYWAAFTLWGNPDPIELIERPVHIYIIIFGILILCFIIAGIRINKKICPRLLRLIQDFSSR